MPPVPLHFRWPSADAAGFDQWIRSVSRIPFDRLPSGMTLRAFGVDYAHVHTADGGDLYVTAHGWPFLRQLLPENWYTGGWYVEAGEKLPGSTGHVYRVPTRPTDGPGMDLVVKFSRVGQEVPLEVATSFPDQVSPSELIEARFNSPLEEFGLVMEMRDGRFGPRDVRLMCHRPLAIYTPPQRFELWQLGRTPARFAALRRTLNDDQEARATAVELDIRREYVLVYSWLKGENAEDACAAGGLTETELRAMTCEVIRDLRVKGFRVLDNKPKHFIVRRDHESGKVLRRRDGRVLYGLVDFELLQRTAEYQREYKYAQRLRYWQLQNPLPGAAPAALPPHLSRMTIMGVEYVFGSTANGGQLWTVGGDPGLFDYFLPERWRRTPRVKLSLTNEVYRTCTRDNIHVIYRRSRVGERPAADPFYEQGKRIRAYGYNSPFEEVAVADRLRRAGFNCVYPRAIYRTGHRSTRAAHLRDERRYATHADLLTPPPASAPILSPHYDYYTILGHFRGMDPHKYYRREGHWGFIDLEKAWDDRLLDEAEYRHAAERTRERLGRMGFASETIDDYDLIIPFNEDESLRRNGDGELEVLWCIDVLTAYEHDLMDEAAYRRTIQRIKAGLEALGYEALNLSGNHLLLALNALGDLRRDEEGEIEVTLCNFELLWAK